MHHHGQINRKEVTVLTPFIHTYTVDVRGGMRCERARYPVGQGDALADRFVVTIMDGGTPVKLTGVGVVATVIRPDGLSVALKGAVQDGAACVTLDDKCYDVAGNITVTLSLEEGEMRQSVLQVTLNVTTGETDVIAETPVLNVADVLAAAKRAEAAADRAEAAGGGGSGGGTPSGMSAYIINLTPNDDGTYTADTTFAQAEEIYNNGRALLCNLPDSGTALAVTAHTPDAFFVFALGVNGVTISVQLLADDSVVFESYEPVNNPFAIHNSADHSTIAEYDTTKTVVVGTRDIAYVKSVNSYAPDRSGNITIPSDVTKDKIIAALGYTPAGEGSGSETVPAYVRTEAETVARLVNQHQSNDSIIFPFLADAHCGYYQDKANAATTLAGQLLHLIGQRAPYDFIVHGGDMANGAWDTTREMTYDQIEDYTELTSDGSRGIPAIWVPGNHDDAPYMATADRVTQKEMYTLIGRKNRASGAVCPNGCNYGYLDLESQHLRVIYLDTDDKRGWGTVQVGSGGTAPAYLNAHNVSGEQLRWLANTALDFSGKDKPAEWSIVVVSHVALDVIGTITDAVSGASHAHNTANAATVLADYVRGDSGSITHGGVTVPYDFSGLDARASVICCVHGHGHKFSSEMVGGILSIGCPNVMNGRERVSSDGKTYTKTPGTANGTSFCILTIDRENSRIYADCVGVGPDREFEYTAEVVPYTNLLPISTDASGAIYNGKGFKEDTYLSGGNDGTKAGIYASGFIPGVAGDYGNYYWYFKNVGMQAGQDSHRLCVYDGSTKALVTTVKTTAASTFVYGEDGNITRWSCNSADYPNGVYIRICCAYLGADSIITANEPIE